MAAMAPDAVQRKKKRKKMPGPFRKVVPAREQRIGRVLVGLLLATAVLIGWKSGQADPVVFEPVAPGPRTTGLLNTIREVPRGALVGAAAGRAPHEAGRSRLEDLAASLPAELEAAGLERAGRIELWPAAKLYEKIDGRAELYVDYGVVGLACTGYAGTGKAPADVYLYLMPSLRHAFGIWAAERREGAPEADAGTESYGGGGAVFFRKGAVYGQVIGGEGWTDDAVAELAGEVARRVPDADGAQEVATSLARLPEDGLVAGSAQFVPLAAFGYDALDDVYHGKYAQEGAGFPAYLWVSVKKDPDRAKKMEAGFLAGLGRRAETLPAPADEDLADATFVRVGDKVHCVFRWEKLVGGVLDAKDRATCELLCDRLMTAIDEADEPGPEAGAGHGK